MPKLAVAVEDSMSPEPVSEELKVGRPAPPNPDQQEKYIMIWAKAVETQMHFNEMSVKSRQLGLTFVAAALGVSIVLLSRGADFAFLLDMGSFKFQLHVSVVLLLGAWLALEAVKGLDLNVYHKMLRGSVAFGEDFEEHYMKQIFHLDKGMTQAISHFSRHQDAGTTVLACGKYKYTGRSQITAEDKIKDFYKFTIRSLWIGSLALFLVTNVTLWFEFHSDPSTKTEEASGKDTEKSETDGSTDE